VLTIGATNNSDLLDPALLRPGRFDRVITFNPPDTDGRCRVLERHLGKTRVEGDIDLIAIARASAGCSPAALMNVVKEAGMLALRAGHAAISQRDLLGGLERVAVGAEKRVVMTEAERRITAYHECGHALATLLLDPNRELRKVSLVGNVHGALGYTWGVPFEESHLRSENDYVTSMRIALAGVAAERVVFGTTTDGAAGDLQMVGRIVKRMVCECGMGGVLFNTEPLSESLRQHLDSEMRRLTDSCYRDVTELLERHRATLDHLASALLANEVLSTEDITRLTATV
jgi:cell division protease FtsH